MRVSLCCGKGVLLYIVGILFSYTLADAASPSSSLPDNAALLYYQACIKRTHITPPFDFEMTLLGHDPSESVREFVRDAQCREVIELVTLGTKMSDCDWGFVPSLGWRPDRSIGTSLHRGAQFVAVSARVLAADGQYKSALNTVLALRRYARHLGDETYGMWVMSEGVDGEALRVVEYLLGVTALNADMLVWLEREFSSSTGPEWHPGETLMNWVDTDGLHAYAVSYARWRETLLPAMKDDVRRQELQNLTETQTLERARRAYRPYIDTAIGILESGIPYEAKDSGIRQLINEARAKAGEGDPIALLIDVLDQMEPYYRLHVNYVAHVNAVKAAIAIYRIEATTGRLPQSLPPGLPKDPYSGQDFDYHVTEHGFSLSCRTPAIDWSEEDNPRRFVFKVAE